MNRIISSACPVCRQSIKKISLAVLLVLSSGVVNAQTVSNVRAAVDSAKAGAEITYDLQGSGSDKAIISLYYSLDNGATYSLISDSLTGDVGAGVTMGSNKKIYWPQMGVTLHAFHGSLVKFRVAALPYTEKFQVQFDTEISSATEGQGTAVINLNARWDYFGLVRYKIGAMTNVTSGTADSDIIPLSGEVQMVSGHAAISVNINDDLIIEKPKALTLDLVYDDSLGYDVGPTFRHMLVLNDNDAYWNGVMMGNKTSDGEQSFRMSILQSGNQFQGKLISAETTGSLSTFPAGEWPLDITYSGNIFTAQTQAAGLPVPSTSVFPDATALTRHVTFTADTAASGIYKPNVAIAGKFEDELVGTGTAAYLGGVTNGGFVLIREQDVFVPPDPPILPLSDFVDLSATQRGSHAEGVLKFSKGTKK